MWILLEKIYLNLNLKGPLEKLETICSCTSTSLIRLSFRLPERLSFWFSYLSLIIVESFTNPTQSSKIFIYCLCKCNYVSFKNFQTKSVSRFLLLLLLDALNILLTTVHMKNTITKPFKHKYPAQFIVNKQTAQPQTTVFQYLYWKPMHCDY